jgi:hypothetical protein
MKNLNQLLRLLIICLSSSTAFGQPTITNQIMMDVGASAPVQYFEQTSFDPGPAGANQSWDMSQIPAKGQPIVWTALEPSQTPWTADFPAATHAFHFPQDSMEGTLYYHYDGNQLNLLGTINTLSTSLFQDTLVYDFNANPQLEMAFPMSYQDQVKDTAMGSAVISFGGNSITVDRTIYRTIRADGYGDLTTPYSSYSNVLRVIIDENVEDRTFGQVVTRQVNRRFYWYSPNEKYLLLQMDSLAVVPTAGPTTVSFNMFYRSGEVTTSIDNNIASDISLKAYPNPADEQLNISLNLPHSAKIKIEILDLQGRLIRSQHTQGMNNISLNTADIAPGIFLLVVQTSEGKASQLITIK